MRAHTLSGCYSILRAGRFWQIRELTPHACLCEQQQVCACAYMRVCTRLRVCATTETGCHELSKKSSLWALCVTFVTERQVAKDLWNYLASFEVMHQHGQFLLSLFDKWMKRFEDRCLS